MLAYALQATASSIAEDTEPHVSYPGLAEAIADADTDWPGSIPLLGSHTRIRISGFAELNAIHDTDAIGTPGEFVTSAIVTRDATAAEGANGETNFSVQPSRLAFETRTPWHNRRIRTFISMDAFGSSSSASPDLRLRHAYGEASNILFGGNLLIGQDWSTYTNLLSVPNTLDFEGPNAVFRTRHPLLRWTRMLCPEVTLKLAAEAPDERVFEDADSVSRWPDVAVVLNSQSEHFNLQGSILARDLRASGDPDSTVSDFGWAASFAGRVHMRGNLKQDFATFSVTGGDGFGGVLNDGPPDAIYDVENNELEAIETLAWLVGYQHWWSPRLYSVVSYGNVWQDNLDIQLPDAFRETQYSSANLVWTPFPQWLLGIEFLYGTREDKDGDTGTDFRTQISSRFSF
ncbi:DcaP family trimeric outer membrane transporter [Microbulbifer taiwanensis]|uniref:DcaP family trimeric outer membrane transporter n=1 Tax=Microbulbifer taiwanensis TaxID=986746 RepID=UPI0029BFBFA5|nr:DcaP family trimeric outer membrane transporter [Microbulbifer taiwanensis]